MVAFQVHTMDTLCTAATFTVALAMAMDSTHIDEFCAVECDNVIWDGALCLQTYVKCSKNNYAMLDCLTSLASEFLNAPALMPGLLYT